MNPARFWIGYALIAISFFVAGWIGWALVVVVLLMWFMPPRSPWMARYLQYRQRKRRGNQ